MTIFEPISTAFRKYADFRGGATRPRFWWFILFITLVGTAIVALTAPLNGRLIEVGVGADSAFGYVSVIVIWAMVILLPTLAVTVRRLHDVGRGEQELLWILLPVAGRIVLGVQLCQPSNPTTLGQPGGRPSPSSPLDSIIPR